MKKAAIIVENRPLPHLEKTIQKHMQHLEGWDLIHIKDVVINNAEDYNRLLTSESFWDIDYDKVLIFQHDSGLLKPIPDTFLDWDYVGAPWKATAPWGRLDRAGGNGGLSLRDVKAHRELLKKMKYEPRHGNEDVFFTRNLANVAPYKVCVKFACETEFALGTVGYHAIDKYLTLSECIQIKTQYGTK